MLISNLIEKLEKLKKEQGDLPIYYKDDWALYALQGVWSEPVDEENAENEDLKPGQPIACIGS